MSDDDTEATLAATYAAVLAAQEACRAGYGAPREVGNAYARCGALVELLSATEQLLEMLGNNILNLRGLPLYHDEGGNPEINVASAAAMLFAAKASAESARRQVNGAWSQLSPIGVNVDGSDD